MKYMVCLLIPVLMAGRAWGGPGTAPRSHVSDYPVSAHEGQFSIGARQLSKTQIRDAFVPDINRQYVVVEVGVFPDAGANVKVTRDQFTLTTSEGETMRPVESREVADSIATQNGWDRTSTRTAVGVGVETAGGRDIDTGTRTGGVYTSTEVMTTIGRRQASIDRVRKELDRKMLPEATVTTATAGYLLFRRPANKPSSYELHFKVDARSVLLVLPHPK